MTTTAAQALTAGTTVTLAGRTFTVDQVMSNLILMFADDTGKGFVVNRRTERAQKVNSLGAPLRSRGNVVLVRVVNDTIEQVA